tara:strand:- start:5609 stop:6271 length:663 start_codon:yes stop_codon:yes gene_type:complete
MNLSDKKQFKQLIDDVSELYGKDKPSQSILRQWWMVLENYPYNIVEQALSYHIKHSKFAPRPADIIEMVEQSDGRPSADEAWAMCLAQSDEYATVWLTEDVQLALGRGASAILADGDKIAARMAFKESYDRIIQVARDRGIPVKRVLSKGHDVTGRDEVIKQGVELGYISVDKADVMMIGHIESDGSKVLAVAYDGIKALTDDEKADHHEKMEELRKLLK